MTKPDLDFDTIDDWDDADNDSLHLLVKDRKTGKYGWHWVYRDRLADHGFYELASYGLDEGRPVRVTTAQDGGSDLEAT